MRTFVFTYNRFDSLTTPQFLDDAGIDHTILCHSEEAKKAFIDGGRVDPAKIIATGAPKGLADRYAHNPKAHRR